MFFEFPGKSTARDPGSPKLLNWSMEAKHYISGWWFQIFVISIPTWGEMIQFHSYFSDGLVQPPTRYAFRFGDWTLFAHQLRI